MTATPGATILLVDDEGALLRLGRRLLERQGYRVLLAESGEAALAVVAAAEEEIHLLLTDLVMPGISGRELAELLLPRHPGMRLLYTSGYTEDEIVRHGISRGGVPFLEKPFTPDSLLAKVREVLASGSSGAAAGGLLPLM